MNRQQKDLTDKIKQLKAAAAQATDDDAKRNILDDLAFTVWRFNMLARVLKGSGPNEIKKQI